jgi:hypothetical protein
MIRIVLMALAATIGFGGCAIAEPYKCDDINVKYAVSQFVAKRMSWDVYASAMFASLNAFYGAVAADEAKAESAALESARPQGVKNFLERNITIGYVRAEAADESISKFWCAAIVYTSTPYEEAEVANPEHFGKHTIEYLSKRAFNVRYTISPTEGDQFWYEITGIKHTDYPAD